MNKKEMMYKNIREHGEKLLVIFPNAIEKDPIKLCKNLFKLENKAHKITTDNCNGLTLEQSYILECSKISKQVQDILKSDDIDIGINGDCRGYALKIDYETVRIKNLTIFRDFGGYGILAPDFKGI